MKSENKSLAETNQRLSQNPGAGLFFDKATKNKIQRHLTDINDHITEEDIRNIDTNITASLASENKNSTFKH